MTGHQRPLRLASLAGRAVIVTPEGAADLMTATDGRFGPEIQPLFARWEELRDWWDGAGDVEAQLFDERLLGPPVPAPRQVFAIGLNYRAHAAEAGLPAPESPPVFTKFPTCLAGPRATVALPSEHVDWEVELVAVIGRRAERADAADAWAHVAGLMVGQDLSERVVQTAGPVPQFSLGKSFPGFGPIGPAIVTPDALEDPDDLLLECWLDGELVQQGRTGDMVFGVPDLIARLSAICPLLPGDLVFTGTPPGVGMARTPPRFLASGHVLQSRIDGLGELLNDVVAA